MRLCAIPKKATIIFCCLFFVLLAGKCKALNFYDYNYKIVSSFYLENSTEDIYQNSVMSWQGTPAYEQTGSNYSAALTPTDYLVIANNPFLSNTEDLNISFEYQDDDYIGYEAILDKAGQYTFITSSGGFNFYINSLACAVLGTAPADNYFHQYNLIFDGSAAYVFIDEVIAGSVPCIGKIPFSSVPLTFSSYIGGNGNIDNIVIRQNADYTSVKWIFQGGWWLIIGICIFVLAIFPITYIIAKVLKV